MDGYDDMGVLGSYLAQFSTAGDVPTSLSGYGYGQHRHRTGLSALGAVMAPSSGLPAQPREASKVTPTKISTAALQVYLIALQVPGVKRTGFLDSQTREGWDLYANLFKEPHANIAPAKRGDLADPKTIWISQQALGRLKEKAQASGRLEAAARGKITSPTGAKVAPISDPVTVPVAELQDTLLRVGWAKADPSGLIDPKTGEPDGRLGRKTRSKYAQSARKRGLNATIAGKGGASSVTVSAATYRALRKLAGLAAEPPPPTPQDKRITLDTNEVQSVLKRLGYSPARLSDGKTGPTTEGAWKESAGKRKLDPFIQKASADLRSVRVSEKTYLMLKADADTKVPPDATPKSSDILDLPPDQVATITPLQFFDVLKNLGVPQGPPEVLLEAWKKASSERNLDGRAAFTGPPLHPEPAVVVMREAWDELSKIERPLPPPGPERDLLAEGVARVKKQSTAAVKMSILRAAFNAAIQQGTLKREPFSRTGPWKTEMRPIVLNWMGIADQRCPKPGPGVPPCVNPREVWKAALVKGVLISNDGRTVKLPLDQAKSLQSAASGFQKAKKAEVDRLKGFTAVDPPKLIGIINSLAVTEDKFDPSGGPVELADAIKTVFENKKLKLPSGNVVETDAPKNWSQVFVRSTVLVELNKIMQAAKALKDATQAFRDSIVKNALKEASASIPVLDLQQAIRDIVRSQKEGTAKRKISSREMKLYQAVEPTGAFDKATRRVYTELARTLTIGPSIQEYERLLKQQLGPRFNVSLVQEVQKQVWSEFLDRAVGKKDGKLSVFTLPKLASAVKSGAASYRKNTAAESRQREQLQSQMKTLDKAIKKSTSTLSVLGVQQGLSRMIERKEIKPVAGLSLTGNANAATKEGIFRIAETIFPEGYDVPETMWAQYLKAVGYVVADGNAIKRAWKGANYISLPPDAANLLAKRAGEWIAKHGEPQVQVVRFNDPSVITVKVPKPKPKEEEVKFEKEEKVVVGPTQPTPPPREPTPPPPPQEPPPAAAKQAQKVAQQKTEEAVQKTREATQKQAEAQQAEIQAQRSPQDGTLRQEADRKHQEASIATQEAQKAAGEAQAAQDVATQAGGAQVTGPTITGPTIQITVPEREGPPETEKAGMLGNVGPWLLGAAGLAAFLLSQKEDQADERYGT